MSERDLIKDLLEQLVEAGAEQLREALTLWQRKRKLDLVIVTLTQDQMAVIRQGLIDSAKAANAATAKRNRTIQSILDELVDRLIDAGVASLMGALK